MLAGEMAPLLRKGRRYYRIWDCHTNISLSQVVGFGMFILSVLSDCGQNSDCFLSTCL